ncbi:hypothetical protein sphantq_02520 [Sphingobium sp. AntQ-1]|uniref:hypothetical protein n=1 Tax=Sphingobium sp. AntQ-1 TaxID=2930091 RepID=UPI00234F0598|nr:hypothetical protein [Sphingobium sp. AntQ-1]WCP14078.1 hypothetical protein sphantq_02520 [Sphingobium sp. AntQ-1]
MFFITASDDRPDGWVNLSDANHWPVWLGQNIPPDLHADVRARLGSNLKHILVGLELKKALIQPHAQGGGVLFEPYFQTLIFEFCVGVFSVLEGLGSAHWLSQQHRDGAGHGKINRNAWRPALCAVYDPAGDHGLDAAVSQTADVRDKLHQDQIGARTAIDWHAMGYEAAFIPADLAIRTLLLRHSDVTPGTTNLTGAPA